jgi:fructan beta-fructosidase
MENANLYHETYRPQFHFTAKNNWLNDPNGLMYYKGEYHLFFQHNPSGIDWGNMTWGHAVSPDMIHWKQMDHAIYPDELGTIFSGSGVVDWNNTAGFKNGNKAVMVCIYTSAGNPFTQSIAYSNDKGRTWTKYENNPVLGNIIGSNRDPKVIWHVPTEKWIMALYLDGIDYSLFSSPNLKEWTRICDLKLPDTGECPDIFELPVDGDINNTKWVFWGGNGNHYIGTFDGQTFTPESELLRTEFGANCYAAQTWSDIPKYDGRRIQIAWMSGGKYPDMPFNQQMSFPCRLELKTTPDGIRMFRQPVREIENIHQKEHHWNNKTIETEEKLLSGDLFDARAEFKLGKATEFGFVVRGEKVQYNAANNQLSCLGKSATLKPIGNKIKLQILVDHTSIEVFGNDGRVSLSSCFLPNLDNTSLGVYADGGDAKITSLNVFELRSVWDNTEF